MAKKPVHTLESLKAAVAARGWKITRNRREFVHEGVDHREITLVATFPHSECSTKKQERQCDKMINDLLGLGRLDWGVGEYTNEDGGDVVTLQQELTVRVRL